MIKIKSLGFEADKVVCQIEFDFNEIIHPFTIKAKVSVVIAMTQTEIKDYVRVQVASKRTALAEAQVKALIEPLIDVDLEEAP